ncbi:MAG: hypothetical protein JWM68_4387 [Verrucomicrobiales bacterium]|nr:hypothetical protein [Verrucomicrobiales bacterium]
MNPYRKAVASVFRLVALGFIFVPLILFGLDFFASKTKQAPAGTLSMILKGGSFLFGLILLFAAGSIARKLTRDLDE